MRKLYKFNHSVSAGGFVYLHKTMLGTSITNKSGLKNLITAISKKFKLLDTTIKVYDDIFFLFFMSKPSLKPIDLIESIQHNLDSFGQWDPKYVYTSVYDLDQTYLKKHLSDLGFDYSEG